MELYKKILIGIDTFSVSWLISLKKINKNNIILYDFNKLNDLKNKIINENIDYVLPLSIRDYMKIINIIDRSKILHPCNETYNLLDNKLHFINYMLKNFFEYIPTVFYLNNKKIQENEYPVISKPIYSTNGYNMKIYYNNDEFMDCKNRLIIQKFIEYEYEYGAYILCINGKIINYKIIRFRYPKYTIKTQNFPENYENIEIFDITIFEKIIINLQYMGGLCINFKMDDLGNIYIFEINPRFGGSAFTNNFIYDLLCIKQ